MPNNHLPGITVFTPAYNRAHLLGRLYESLKTQSCPQLEWLVVDDGSTDNTKQQMEAFAEEGIVDIRYLYKDNGGKHTAMNMGIREASREYFLCIDSDDSLMPGALAQLLEVTKSQPAGIIAYKQDMATGKRIGDSFPEELNEATLIDLINIYHCNGDRTLIYRTELLQAYPIPEPPGQHFFPETWLYDRVDSQSTCLLLPQDICLCEYQTGGYSDTFRQLMLRNSLSMKWFFADRLDLAFPFKVRFDAAYRYIAFSIFAKNPLGRCHKKHWPLLLAALPMGLAMAIHYRLHN